MERWRSWGARTAEVHIDDGLAFVPGKEKALQLSQKVRQDLNNYGLLISEDKCSWGARRRIEWIGFVWDTKSFKMYVPEDKLEWSLQVIKDILRARTRKVAIKEVQGVCSLMTSMHPALGDIARFTTRFMLQLVARSQQESGWGARVELDELAVLELQFWSENLERLNGFPIRPKPRQVDV